MDFLELAAERYSVRSYSERPIEQEKMDRILKAAQLAPTAVNYQPQKIYVLKSIEAIQKIRTLTQFAYDAPVVLLVCADMTKVWKHSLCSFFHGKLSAFVTNSSRIHFCCFIDTVFPVFCGKKNAVDRQESASI